MITRKIKINTIGEAKKLNEIAVNCDCDIDLKLGRYIVDAKSIMGIFSLNLLETVTLMIDSSDQEVIHLFDKFILKE